MTIITHAILSVNGCSSSAMVVEDGSPTYAELRDRVAKLEKELEEANKRADDNWETLEDVACGAKLECPKCGKCKPCDCDHDT